MRDVYTAMQARTRLLTVAAIAWIVAAIGMVIATTIAAWLYAPPAVLLWLAIPTAGLWAGMVIVVLGLVFFVLNGA
jgi:multisubunit Na+/H+ antiporter MnhG subunit